MWRAMGEAADGEPVLLGDVRGVEDVGADPSPPSGRVAEENCALEDLAGREALGGVAALALGRHDGRPRGKAPRSA